MSARKRLELDDGRKHPPIKLAKSDAYCAWTFAPAAENHGVAVFQKSSMFILADGQRLRAPLLSSTKEPASAGVGPDCVPLPNRSPGRRLQPLTVWCATSCEMLQ